MMHTRAGSQVAFGGQGICVPALDLRNSDLISESFLSPFGNFSGAKERGFAIK